MPCKNAGTLNFALPLPLDRSVLPALRCAALRRKVFNARQIGEGVQPQPANMSTDGPSPKPTIGYRRTADALYTKAYLVVVTGIFKLPSLRAFFKYCCP